MRIHVEFFGIPRARAGVASHSVELPGTVASLADVLSVLTERLPEFAAACLQKDRLRPGFVASVDGGTFGRQLDMLIRDGQTLLILSTDAGG